MVNESALWRDLLDLCAKIEAGPTLLEWVLLTDDQINTLHSSNCTPSCRDQYFGIPVERVATVEESTPFRLSIEKAERDGYKVVEFGGKHFAVKP